MKAIIIKYPDLKGTQKDQQSPGPGPAQDSPMNRTMCLEIRQRDGAKNTQRR